MGRETTLFSSEETKSRSEIAGFLHALADRLKTGQITLRHGADEIVLDLPDTLVLELKVEDEDKRNKGTQHSLEVEVKWYDDMAPKGALELG